jgi:hypothetical protein
MLTGAIASRQIQKPYEQHQKQLQQEQTAYHSLS